MERINKDTQLCISIAERPSNFGTTILNAAFESQGDNYIYKACKVNPDPGSLRSAIEGIRVLGIRGCGVSMPFKVMVVEMLDGLDEDAEKIGSINTIVNEAGRLIGYNTDYYAALEALKAFISLDSKIFLLGSGGVAMAICAALRKLNAHDVTIHSRNYITGEALASKWNYKFKPGFSSADLQHALFINATSIGMTPNTDISPLDQESLTALDTIMDLVVSPLVTKLAQEASKAGKAFIPGSRISLFQAARQYMLYTNKTAPIKVMEEAINKIGRA